MEKNKKTPLLFLLLALPYVTLNDCPSLPDKSSQFLFYWYNELYWLISRSFVIHNEQKSSWKWHSFIHSHRSNLLQWLQSHHHLCVEQHIWPCRQCLHNIRRKVDSVRTAVTKRKTGQICPSRQLLCTQTALRVQQSEMNMELFLQKIRIQQFL